jgi:hypothetical protein
MTNGGKRPGAGRPKGRQSNKTLVKEVQREQLRQLVFQHQEPLIRAQLANALGLRHTFMRDAGGRFVQLTDPQQIADALNSGDEGKYYSTFTKDPSIAAFTDLMNRALDKPKEQEQELAVSATAELVALLQSARKRTS